jgi:APA family basic amino acid/polyamine antiporter
MPIWNLVICHCIFNTLSFRVTFLRMSQDDFSLFTKLVRRDSNAFVKKPLPSESNNDLSVSTGEKASLLTRRDSSGINPSYESFDCDSILSSKSLERHLDLIDLTLIGIGSTIGSGLFVLCGLVANQYAGPASILSWAVSGLAALLSGTCYAELSSRIPLAGSAYAYAFVAMGELPAVIAAACLSVEYIAAASAVARSWGDKIVEWLSGELGSHHWATTLLENESSFSPFAMIVSSASVILLMNGIEGSKTVINIFTKIKVCVVIFMIVAGLVLMRPSNFEPFVPAKFGPAGIFRGATATFFGYLGYDEIACLGGEAKNPKKNLPKAIFFTLGSVTSFYILAAVALVGMLPYEDISPVSGFPSAFRDSGAPIAAEIAALGEIVTLPIVVLITIMAQPRLQYALSKDGLLPPVFSEFDDQGNLTKGTLFCGIIMVLVSSFVPFTHLNDMISCAVLTALSLTDTSLILLWYPSPKDHAGLAESVMGTFHAAALLAGVLLTHFASSSLGRTGTIISTLIMIICIYVLIRWCPKAHAFGNSAAPGSLALKPKQSDFFCTPFMPYLPCFGIMVNWYLISQLGMAGIFLHLGFLVAIILYYLLYAINHSVGNNGGWLDKARVESMASFLSVSNDEDYSVA